VRLHIPLERAQESREEKDRASTQFELFAGSLQLNWSHWQSLLLSRLSTYLPFFSSSK